MVSITRGQLTRFAPVAKPELVDALVEGAEDIRKAGITTPLRLQHFLTQLATETGGFRATEENMRYSAERMTKVWPSRFPTVASAKPYAMNPEKLANKVYGGRLGNNQAGDGWRYRGGGMMQTTGRTNYRAAGFEDNPDELRSNPRTALLSALKFWSDNHCNRFADADDLVGLRRRINGGTHGLSDARNYLAKAKAVFGGDTASAPSLSRGKVTALQNQLIRLGYVEVGKADGWVGPKTIGATSAFQAEHGLTINGTFDGPTQEHLYVAEPRDVLRSTPAPVESRIIKDTSTLKKAAGGAIATGAAMAGERINDLAGDPLSAIDTMSQTVERLNLLIAPLQAITDIVGDNWFLLAIVAGFGLYKVAKRIEFARLEDHVSGKTS